MKKLRSLLSIILTISIIAAMNIIAARNANESIVEVETAALTTVDMYDTLTLRGKIIELCREPIYAKQSCIVVNSNAAVGKKVTAGEYLMRLKPIENAAAAGQAVYSDLQQAVESFADAIIASGGEDIESAASGLADSLYALETPGTQSQDEIFIYSPIDGIVMQAVAAGDTVSPVLPCVIVSDMSRLALSALVSEHSVASIKESMECTVNADAFGGEYPGKISTIMPYARQTGMLGQSQEVKTEVIVAIESNNSLRPGYSASARVITSVTKDALVVPYQAIGQDDSGEYVMLLKNAAAKKVYISTGTELEDKTQILSGVGESDILIMHPEQLKNGQRVTVKAAIK